MRVKSFKIDGDAHASTPLIDATRQSVYLAMPMYRMAVLQIARVTVAKAWVKLRYSRISDETGNFEESDDQITWTPCESLL